MIRTALTLAALLALSAPALAADTMHGASPAPNAMKRHAAMKDHGAMAGHGTMKGHDAMKGRGAMSNGAMHGAKPMPKPTR